MLPPSLQWLSAERLLPPAADVDGRAEFEKALGRAFAKPGAAPGDQDSFGLEKIVAKHGWILKMSGAGARRGQLRNCEV